MAHISHRFVHVMNNRHCHYAFLDFIYVCLIHQVPNQIHPVHITESNILSSLSFIVIYLVATVYMVFCV